MLIMNFIFVFLASAAATEGKISCYIVFSASINILRFIKRAFSSTSQLKAGVGIKQPRFCSTFQVFILSSKTLVQVLNF